MFKRSGGLRKKGNIAKRYELPGYAFLLNPVFTILLRHSAQAREWQLIFVEVMVGSGFSQAKINPIIQETNGIVWSLIGETLVLSSMITTP